MTPLEISVTPLEISVTPLGVRLTPKLGMTLAEVV